MNGLIMYPIGCALLIRRCESSINHLNLYPQLTSIHANLNNYSMNHSIINGSRLRGPLAQGRRRGLGGEGVGRRHGP